MKWALCVGLIVGILIAHFAQAGRVDADHGRARCGGTGQIACIVSTSPFVENVIKNQGDYTYCLNPRASAYGGFRSQVAKVTQAHAASLKLTAREVPYPSSPADKSCAVRHDMPDNHGCSGCAAWIYVTSYPVVIEYKWQLGFVHWDATVGHELGHGECLMDESYIRATGQSHILTTGTWIHGYPTVMDTGTYLLSAYAPLGIWDLTPGDLDRCEETIGRDLDEPVEPPTPPYYDAARNCDFYGYWCYVRPSGPWIDPNGNSEWGALEWVSTTAYYQYNWRLQKYFRFGQLAEEHFGGLDWRCLSGCF